MWKVERRRAREKKEKGKDRVRRRQKGSERNIQSGDAAEFYVKKQRKGSRREK